MKKRKQQARAPKRSALTLDDVVKAAHEAGATVSVSLVPRQPERPLLSVPAGQWPGDPGNRSVLAGLNVTNKEIAREFKDSPSSKWVITPYEIVEREAFFKKLDEVLCIKCGAPAAFPKAVTKPYICLTCQPQPTTTATPKTT